jgi:hypothetical protein
MVGRRQLMRQDTNGTRNRDVKEQLRLVNERTTRGINRKSTGLEIAKRIARVLLGQKESEIGPCGGVDPSKTKKKTPVRGGAGNVKASAPTTRTEREGTLSCAAPEERT